MMTKICEDFANKIKNYNAKDHENISRNTSLERGLKIHFI